MEKLKGKKQESFIFIFIKWCFSVPLRAEKACRVSGGFSFYQSFEKVGIAVTGLYSFAGKQVAVDSLYTDIHDLCTDYRVFGTPWDGKLRLSRNIAVPLRAICLLERAEENSICAISPHQAYAALMAQAYRPVRRRCIIPGKGR